MQKRQLQELIGEHKERALSGKGFIAREAAADAARLFKEREIHIVTGVRRCGKSTLMRLLMEKLVAEQGVKQKNILYLNFDDERFTEFVSSDFQTLYESFLEIESPKGKKYFFLDEIQNITGWHRWINRLYEFEDVKIFLTGSNASLLSGEIATTLTGRNRVIELYPFSFREFLAARGFTVSARDALVSERRALIRRLLQEYLTTGGFPEVVKTGDLSLLQHYFKDILYRDIIARYGVRNIREIKELVLFLASNLASIASYKRLKDVISVNSQSTVKNYLSHLEDVYLFFATDLFDYSLKRQMYNPSKVYCVDHALAGSMAFRFSSELGRTLENIVFLELKRRGRDIYYWKGLKGEETDFLLKQGRKITAAIQVSYDVNAVETKQRESVGAVQAAREFGLKNAIVINSDYSGEEKSGGITIRYVPLWQWLTTAALEL